jgi:hypothetical protein
MAFLLTVSVKLHPTFYSSIVATICPKSASSCVLPVDVSPMNKPYRSHSAENVSTK